MQVEIVNQPSMRVAAVRHIGPYTEVSEAFERLSKIAGEAGLFAPGVLMLGLYHDDPNTIPANELRSDAALTIGDGVKSPDGTAEMTVPAGRYAKLVYTGPYSGLPGAWGEVTSWVQKGGEKMTASMSYELYLNDPTDTAPEDLITEIYLPLS